jgi:hypothetical protein
MKFSNTLIHWYLQNKEIALAEYYQSIPIWLSEIMFNKHALLKVRLIF